MKKIIQLAIGLVLVIGSLQAQTIYGNEWIDYNKTYFKFKIAQDRLYRISFELLDSTFIQPGVSLSTINGRNFQLWHKGQEVPIYVTNDGIFSTGDYIEFYGKRNDGTFDTKLYKDSTWQLQSEYSLFSDSAAYFLTWDNNVVSTARIINTPNDISAFANPEPYFMHVSKKVYAPGSGLGYSFMAGSALAVGGVFMYDSYFDIGEGFASNTSFNASVLLAENISTPHIYNTGNAKVSLSVIGNRLDWPFTLTSTNTHQLKVLIGANTIIDAPFMGVGKFSVDVPVSYLNAVTTLNFSTYGNYSNEGNRIGYVNITYPRQFNFDGVSMFPFNISSGSYKYLQISNFNTKGTDMVLYDLTNNIRILDQGQQLKFRLPPSASERKLFITSQASDDILLLNNLLKTKFTNFRDPNNQGDFIIISSTKLANDGNGNNYIEEYKTYKKSVGYKPLIAWSEELSDQFAFGIPQHPLSIQIFTTFMLERFTAKPQFVFLIGKGIEFTTQKDHPLTFVPTYGFPGSDNILTATISSYVPRIPIGRIPAFNAEDVLTYLNKIKEYDAAASLPQTISDKAWMKNILHFGGGATPNEQKIFKDNLRIYENILENPYYGGDVTSFFKTSSDPFQIAQSDLLDSMIETGVSIMDFFGHSSSNLIDYNIDNPANYNNKGKYPFIVANGCRVGNIFLPYGEFDFTKRSLGEQFVMIKDKGAIGFVAPQDWGVIPTLHIFSQNLMNNISKLHYGEGIGKAVQATIQTISENNPNSLLHRFTAQQETLNGDPSINLNSHPLPDYAIEKEYTSFSPNIVSLNNDSFHINLDIYNLGKTAKSTDSIIIRVLREFPDGSKVPNTDIKIRGTYYRDQVLLSFKTNEKYPEGLNRFHITVDANNQIREISELNNTIILETYIISNDIRPIFPYEYSIVSNNDITLAASTPNIFMQARQYKMQIDTSYFFNSPIKETTISQIGGILKWKPGLQYSDSTVYYWRVGVDSGANTYWNTSSFVYMPNTSPGWNQSHFFQLEKNEFDNIDSLDLNTNSARKLEFVNDIKTVYLKNGVFPGEIAWNEIAVYLNGKIEHNWTACNDWVQGIFFMLFDPVTGMVIEAKDTNLDGYEDTFSSTLCAGRTTLPVYEFRINQPWGTVTDWNTKIKAFVDSIKDSVYVLGWTYADPGAAIQQTWDQSVYQSFRNLGLSELDSIVPGTAYSFWIQKGKPSTKIEMLSDSVNNLNAQITGKWTQGYIETPIIGPAKQWKELKWQMSNLEPMPSPDVYSIDVIGIKQDGQEVTLLSGSTSMTTNLDGFIDATVYPKLKLRAFLKDDTYRTPPQLDFWRVTYDDVPEAALNPAAFYSFYADTINQGDKLKFSIAVENISNLNMDSLLIRYKSELVNGTTRLTYQRKEPLLAKDSLITYISFELDPESFKPGMNTLFVEVNPDKDQLEQYHFNNIGLLQYYVKGDKRNPLLDVTFDGVHILDRDIVSAKPEILINLKDDNQFLALDDTSLFKIYLRYPDGTLKPVTFNGTTMAFTPASKTTITTNNTAQVKLTPEFTTDGVYELIVQGRDRSQNQSGNLDYKIAFTVETEATISNVLNYPNPFTTSTKFIFEVTGSELPTFLKIQIMTITGKVVREIMLDELGPLHIGRNITEFAWDGTDQYGDPLANGVYLYRVVAKLNGEEYKHREKSYDDQYFKSGFGKMYLMR